MVDCETDHLIKAPKIQGQMGVGKNTAVLYRRLWHLLGLVEDVPGKWNPLSLAELDLGMHFDGNAIEDGTDGYAEWRDPNDLNDPAEVWLKTREPRAFQAKVEELTGGEPLDLRVANRYIDRSEPPNPDDSSVARCARSEVPAWVWFEQEHGEKARPKWFKDGGTTNTYYYSYRYPSDDEPLRHGVHSIGSDDPPPLLLLVPDRDQIRAGQLASEASTTRSRQGSPDGTFTKKDLETSMGYSRSTARRRVLEWEAQGLVEQVGYGTYQFTEAGLNAPQPIHAPRPPPGS